MIRRIAIYLLCVAALLYLLRYLHYQGLLKSAGYYAKYREAFLEHARYDVLFLGSSRVEMHYDTRAFDSLTGRNSFNLGLPGATVHEAYAALKGYLAVHPPPETLLYEVDYTGLDEKTTGLMEFRNFFPFLSNRALRRELQRIDPRMEWFRLLPFMSWPYTGWRNLSTSIHGWLGIPAPTDRFYYKGFYREDLRPAMRSMPRKPRHSWFHVSERAYLDSLALLSENKNMQLVLLTSPVFGGGNPVVSNKGQITAQISAVASIHRVPYYDLSAIPVAFDTSAFVDPFHMNYRGAQRFTPFMVEAFNNKIRHRAFSESP